LGRGLKTQKGEFPIPIENQLLSQKLRFGIKVRNSKPEPKMVKGIPIEPPSRKSS